MITDSANHEKPHSSRLLPSRKRRLTSNSSTNPKSTRVFILRVILLLNCLRIIRIIRKFDLGKRKSTRQWRIRSQWCQKYFSSGSVGWFESCLPRKSAFLVAHNSVLPQLPGKVFLFSFSVRIVGKVSFVSWKFARQVGQKSCCRESGGKKWNTAPWEAIRGLIKLNETKLFVVYRRRPKKCK